MRPQLIEEVLVYPLEIPLKREFRTSHAVQRVAKAVVVEVRSGGLSGFGEADPRPHITGETVESVVAVLRDYLIPAVIGQSVFDLATIHRAMAVVELNPSAKSSIDVAVFDLLGKVTGRPVKDLLGGNAGRPVVPNAWAGIGDDLDETVATVLAKVESGLHRAAKVKVGVDAARERRLIEVLAGQLPAGVDLIVDANQAWDYPTARRRIAEFAGTPVSVVEQPVPWDDLTGMRKLTGSSSLSIMADESVRSPRDALLLANTNGADMLNLKLLKCGGLYPASMFLSVAEAAGMPCMVGSTVQTSISAAAQAHLAAARGIIKFADIALPDDFLLEDIAEGFILAQGEVMISDKPGLGLEVRQDLLARYAVT